MNGYSKIVAAVVTMLALAGGVGTAVVGNLDGRIDQNEDRINACSVDTAVILANSQAAVDTLRRIELRLDRLEDKLDGRTAAVPLQR